MADAETCPPCPACGDELLADVWLDDIGPWFVCTHCGIKIRESEDSDG